tara:strand:+ start:8221 stop:8928 length:708 start_codon:yes stop_codon:yes gene_type:complete
MNALKNIKKSVQRDTILMQEGRCNTDLGLFASYFGQVRVSQVTEAWPYYEGQPMLPLLQINLETFPTKPKGFEDIAFLCVFTRRDQYPVDTTNKKHWEIRTYKTLDNLVPLTQPTKPHHLQSFTLHPELKTDFPCWEEGRVDESALEERVEDPDDIFELYQEHFPTLEGIKLGGWPYLVQAEISWDSDSIDNGDIDFLIQIDSTEKGRWCWGYQGIAYLGRCIKTGEWFLTWQCY